MNDHPEELLAEYVEGALDTEQRELVERHLEACARCREEVDLSTQGRAAAVSLPDLAAPPGLPLSVRRRARRAPSPAWGKVAAVAAGVVVAGGLLFAVGQLDLGGQGGGEAQTAAGDGPEELGEEPAPEPGAARQEEAGVEDSAKDDPDVAAATAGGPPALPIYVESNKDYTRGGLAPLARGLRDEARAAIEGGLEPTAEAFFRDFDAARFTPPVRQAIRCVLAEVPPQQLIVPYRIEAAAFQGTRAYIAAFLQGPTPGHSYDRVVIWVVDRERCTLLSLASQVL